MIFRKLEEDDYPKLEHVGEGFIPPKDHLTVVAEYQDEIVGRVFLLALAHTEGLWVKEDFRNSTVLSGLMNELEAQAKSLGIKKVVAYAVDDTIADYAQRLGYKKWDVTVWTKEL